MKCDFSFKHYKETLKLFKKNNYYLCSFKNKNLKKKKYVLLRHDLECTDCIKKAIKFAKIENYLGITATYSIRIHAEYNPFAKYTYSKIHKIMSFKHEIAFHYETNKPDKVLREKKILEFIYGIKISTLIPHGETSSYKKNYIPFKNYCDPYSSKFFKDIKYISDSGKQWRNGCLCKWVNKKNKLQILTHPLWWT